jgi:hypothetical protein
MLRHVIYTIELVEVEVHEIVEETATKKGKDLLV